MDRNHLGIGIRLDDLPNLASDIRHYGWLVNDEEYNEEPLGALRGISQRSALVRLEWRGGRSFIDEISLALA